MENKGIKIDDYANKEEFFKIIRDKRFKENISSQISKYFIETFRSWKRTILKFQDIFEKFDYYFYEKLVHEEQQNKFENLPEEVKKIFFDLQRNKIFQIKEAGIILNKAIFKNKTNYQQAITLIKKFYDNLKLRLIIFIFKKLYQKELEVFCFNEILKEYRFLKNKFKFKERKNKNSTSISTGKKSSSPKKTKNSGVSGQSPPQPDLSVEGASIDFNDLFTWLEEKKWEYSIWISKVDRDHNFQLSGRIDHRGELFRKLVDGLGLTFSEHNGGCTVVHSKGKKDDGLYFAWQLTNKGYNRFWKKEDLSWELFIKNLYNVVEPCELTDQEFGELLECLKDSQKEQLFLLTSPEDLSVEDFAALMKDEREGHLETANLIGPAKVIKEKFNKACLIYHKVYHRGKYHPVMLKIDKSKGPYEIEFIGPYKPTRALQDVTVRAFETVESLSRFEFILETFVQKYIETNEVVSEVHALEIETNKVVKANNKILEKLEPLESLSSFASDLRQNDMSLTDSLNTIEVMHDNLVQVQAKQFSHEIQTDLHHLELKEHFRDVLEGVKNNSQNLEQSIILLDRGIQEIKEHHADKLGEVELDIVQGLNTIDSNMRSSTVEIKDEIQNGVKQIREDINFLSRDLKDLINRKFEESRVNFRNNLYLILRKLDKVPELTAKEISKEFDVSLKTVYKYLRKLEKKGLIKCNIKESKGRGRPPKVFKLHLKKLFNLIKK